MEDFTVTEQKILNAAREIFLEKGRDGSRMQEIAGRAGINKALLHYYFRTKDKLYTEVFKNEIQSFFENLLLSIPDTDNIENLIKNFVNDYIDRLADRPEIIRFVIWEIQQRGNTFADILKNILTNQGYSEIPLLRRIEEAIATEKIRKANPTHLAISIIGVCVYPFIARPILERIFTDIQIGSQDFLEERKVEVFKLIWNGIKP
jgi:AcrR family transcriptional regulator